MEVNSRLNSSAALHSGKTPSTDWIGGWVRPRAKLDVVERENPCPSQELNPGCPVTLLAEL